MPILLSVNVGKPESLHRRAEPSGINKRPVNGPVYVGELGLEQDAIIDRKHHGGPDQALYLYLSSDYDWWARELSMPFPPGTFGENLTIEGLNGDNLAVGDRFLVGDVLIEITSHREPCATLSARMGDPTFVRRFHRAHRPGAYCRVLQPGPVEAGMTMDYQPRAGETVTLRELVDTEGLRQLDPGFMRRALTAPLHWKMRRDYEAALAGL